MFCLNRYVAKHLNVNVGFRNFDFPQKEQIHFTVSCIGILDIFKAGRKVPSTVAGCLSRLHKTFKLGGNHAVVGFKVVLRFSLCVLLRCGLLPVRLRNRDPMELNGKNNCSGFVLYVGSRSASTNQSAARAAATPPCGNLEHSVACRRVGIYFAHV